MLNAEDKIKEIMTDILDLNTKITNDFGPEQSVNWDSMNNLRMITALEEAFGIQFTMEEIALMQNFSIIKDTVFRKAKKN
jgi:acyl carrier protein